MPSMTVPTLAAWLALSLSIGPAAATPLPNSPTQWIEEILHPNPGGGSIYDEVQCYGLPYGGFGFLSHVLSYYTATCLIFGRKPLFPWDDLKHSIFDTFLCIVSMGITVTTSAFTIDSCRNSWPFVLIAVWKLTLSFSLNAVGLFSSAAARKKQKEKSNETEIGRPFAATYVYWCGSIVGMVGIFDIVHQTFADNRNVRITTGILIGLSGIMLVFALVIGLLIFLDGDDPDDRAENRSAGRGVMIMSPAAAIAIAIAIAVFYSDWTLAAVQNNWAGTPSGDFVYLYWIYFAAKRLPMFSW